MIVMSHSCIDYQFIFLQRHWLLGLKMSIYYERRLSTTNHQLKSHGNIPCFVLTNLYVYNVL